MWECSTVVNGFCHWMMFFLVVAVQCFIGHMDTMFDDLILVLLRLCLVEWCVICSYICDSELVQQNGLRYKRFQTKKTTNKKWSHVKIQLIIDFGSAHETETCIDKEKTTYVYCVRGSDDSLRCDWWKRGGSGIMWYSVVMLCDGLVWYDGCAMIECKW